MLDADRWYPQRPRKARRGKCGALGSNPSTITNFCGCSSVVECLVANQIVEGSTPFSRSKFYVDAGRVPEVITGMGVQLPPSSQFVRVAKRKGTGLQPRYPQFDSGFALQLRAYSSMAERVPYKSVMRV